MAVVSLLSPLFAAALAWQHTTTINTMENKCCQEVLYRGPPNMRSEVLKIEAVSNMRHVLLYAHKQDVKIAKAT